MPEKFHPSPRQPDNSSNTEISPQKLKIEKQQKRRFERVTGAPLLHRKVLLYQPFTLYPSVDAATGRRETRVPATFSVLGHSGTRLHLANRVGSSIGWVEAQETVAWNTRIVWRPRTNRQPIMLYSSRVNARQRRGGRRLPAEFLNGNSTFPILQCSSERADSVRGLGEFQVGAPFGQHQHANQFPSWVRFDLGEDDDDDTYGVLAEASTLQSNIASYEFAITRLVRLFDIA